MPTVTFHGGKLNNRKRFIDPLNKEYVYEYVKSNIKGSDLLNWNSFGEDVYFEKIREVYILTKVSKQVNLKRITKIGYVKEGSKTKAETVWNKGLFHSEIDYVDLGGIGYWK